MEHMENLSGQDNEMRRQRLSILAKVARGVRVDEDIQKFPQFWEDQASALKLLEGEPLLLAMPPIP